MDAEMNIEDVSENVEPIETAEEVAAEVEAPKEEVPAPYTPDFKFKVMDKEHEIEEIYRPLVKDEETFKKIKEMHEKAYGLNVVKEKHQLLNERVKNEFEPTIHKFKQMENNFQVLDKMLEKGDYDNFFSALGLSDNDVLKWAANKARLMQLTPEEQASYNKSIEANAKNYSLEQELADIKRQQRDFSVQQQQMSLDNEMSRPDVLSHQAAFDARVGKPGAFKEFVIQQAVYAAQFEKLELSPREAVERSLKLVGMATPQVEEPTTQNGSVGTQSRVVIPSTTPTIPALKGGSASPVKKGFKSLDEIKAYAKQLASQE